MPKYSTLRTAVSAVALFAAAVFSSAGANDKTQYIPVGFANISVSGELNSRVLRNMARLEDERSLRSPFIIFIEYRIRFGKAKFENIRFHLSLRSPFTIFV